MPVLATPTLLERDSELDAIESALGGAAGGVRTVLVEGDAGAGKSRLLEEAAACARARGMRVLTACGSQLERHVPFGVALQLFEAAVLGDGDERRDALLRGPAAVTRPLFEHGHVDHASGGGDQGFAIVHGLRWLLAHLADASARTAPIAIVVDDLHWADTGSLRFLARASAAQDLPVTLILAGRGDAPGEASGVLDDGARVLRLAPLSAEAAAAMVCELAPGATPAFVAACVQIGRGSPFHLRELLRVAEREGLEPGQESVAALQRLVPDAVQRSVEREIARLGPDAEALAAAAAVVGEGISLRLAAALAELSPLAAERAADALVAADLLARSEPLAFEHPLVHAALHRRIPEQARSRGHRRTADLLRAEGAAVEAIAAHLLLVRPDADGDVVALLREAAERAHRRGEHEGERRLLERALAEPPDAATRVELIVALALAEAAAGVPEAAGRVHEALTLVDDAEQRAQVLRALARVRFVQSRFDDARDAIEAALDLVDAGGALAVDIATDALAIGFVAPSADGPSARVQAIVAAASPRGVPTLQAFSACAALMRNAPPEDVVALACTALERLPDDDRFFGVPTCLALMPLVQVERLDLAAAGIEATLDRAGRAGSLIATAFATHLRAEVRYRRGELAAAIADSTAVLDISEAGWDVCRGWIVPLLVRAHLDRGDVAAARAAFALAGDLARWPSERHLLLDARGRLELADGDGHAALASFMEAGSLLAGVLDLAATPWRSGAAQAAASIGLQEHAVRLAEDEVQAARTARRPRALAIALRVAGALTDGPAGHARLAEAVAVLDRIDAPLELARAVVEHGAVLRRAGRRSEARPLLRRGLALAEGLEVAPLVARARDELRAAGGRRSRPREHEGPGALTPAQRRVAELAAEGLASAQIAAQLFLTPKTVDWHLGHAYRKLDISSRRQLQRALGQQRPPELETG